MSVRSLCALCALLALAPTTRASVPFVGDALKVIKIGQEIGTYVLNAWDLVESFREEKPPSMEQQVLDRLRDISRDMNRLEIAVIQNGAIAMMLAKNVGKGAGLEIRLQEIADLLSRVTDAHRQMREYVQHKETLERSTLETFAQLCVSDASGELPDLLERIHSLIVPPHKNLLGRELLQMVLEELKPDHPDWCGIQMSQHQLIYDMYTTIALTEIKGYATMQYAFMLLKIYGKGNFTSEASLARSRYEVRTAQAANAARAALTMAKRDLYRCDPPRHEKGTTYAQVTGQLQGYIINLKDLNKERSCSGSCSDFYYTDSYGCTEEHYCNNHNTCGGVLRNCELMSSATVCPSDSNSSRIFEWIKFGNGRTFGTIGQEPCTRSEIRVDWWNTWFSQCSYCFCLCDTAERDRDRYFSLREVVSDVANNKVVTGVRLVKHGRVFHLQISEGILGESGAISPGSWVPVDTFDPGSSGAEEYRDYTTVSYGTEVALHEKDSEHGRVLTGVRFHRDWLYRIHLDISTTPFNFTTGRLQPGPIPTWIYGSKE